MQTVDHPTWNELRQSKTYEKTYKPFELPGFIENGVTYESHHYTVILTLPVEHSWDNRTATPRSQGALVKVRHGGGDEYAALNYRLAEPLRYLLEERMHREAFFLCHALFDAARENQEIGRQKEGERLKRAFVEGCLRKRKQRGRATYKVWVDNARAS